MPLFSLSHSPTYLQTPGPPAGMAPEKFKDSAKPCLANLPPELITHIFRQLELPHATRRTLGDVGALRLALPGCGKHALVAQPEVRDRIAGAVARAYVRGELPCGRAGAKVLRTYVAGAASLDLSDIADFHLHKAVWRQHGVESIEQASAFAHLAGFFLGSSAPMQRRLTTVLRRATHLRHLVLRHNGLTALLPAILQVTRLQTLNLNHNQLVTLPAFLAELAQLKTLCVCSNPLQEFPKAVLQLPKLAFLSLYATDFIHLPRAIGENTQLQTLDLQDVPLTHLPDEVGKLTHLTTLDLTETLLTQLPETLGNMRQLQRLLLQGTPLLALPASTVKLQKLTELDISLTGMSEVPHVVGFLAALQHLTLDAEQIAELPAAVLALRTSKDFAIEGPALALLRTTLRNQFLALQQPTSEP